MTKIEKANLLPRDFHSIQPDGDETVTGLLLSESPDYYAVLVIDDLLPDDITLLSRRAFALAPDATRSLFYTEMLQACFPDGLQVDPPVPLRASAPDWLAALAQSGAVFGMEWLGEGYRIMRILGQSPEGWQVEEVHYDGSLEDYDTDDLSSFDMLTVGGRYLRGVQTWLSSKAVTGERPLP